jgi:hypothetical protein
MLHRVDIVRTDVSEEHIPSIITAKSQRAMNNVSSNCFTLMMEAIRSAEIPVVKRATRRHIPEDDFLDG